MKLAVPRERTEGERRVALAPESVKKLVAAGFTVAVERGAGEQAFFKDEEYTTAGAAVLPTTREVYASGEIVLKVGPPLVSGGVDEVALMSPGAMLVTGLMPLRNLEAVRRLAAARITSFSTDAIPRTTRAQAMDTLSSMASITGYKGVLLAAAELGRYAPMLTTAAGTIFPAKFFVVGAGVAGLQAIATARRLGATVFATDVRPEVKEQIESVGARYVGVDLKQSASAGGGYAGELSEQDKARQRELLVEQCAVSDVVVTTALIGGVFAPRLITAEMVRRMKPGSIVMDLAAEGGGNCELSKPGQTVVEGGVTIMAPLNLPSGTPADASRLWSRNLTNFLLAFSEGGQFKLDLADEILKAALVTREGEVVHAKTKEALEKAAGRA